MPFSGKATYSAGSELPEIAEDVSDLVAINSPHDTPLLDVLGDAARPARSTVHEWLEDALLPNSDTIAHSFSNPLTDSTFGVLNPDRFRVGDQVQPANGGEVMLVTAVSLGDGTISVQRTYGGSSGTPLGNGTTLRILGNAALEGDDAAAPRFTTRHRRTNYTQIFSATVEISGSELAVQKLAVADELEYQKQQRLRELMRDLENCVINGRAASVDPEGAAGVRRTMRGIIPSIVTHRFKPGVGGFPPGDDLSEEQLHLALREIWRGSSAQVDLILVGASVKRAINNFVATSRRFGPESEKFKDLVSVYESDFGTARIILSRWVPPGALVLLDSSRLGVLPLSGRSFHFRRLAATGDRESGQVIGEYTLELRNENAHGMIELL